MRRAFIRLDDACEKMDTKKWHRMERLLDKYRVVPLVGLIPNCKDGEMEKYSIDNLFWSETVQRWKNKHWYFALHGYEHVYHNNNSGINPVNKRSEFAGLSLNRQRKMIKAGCTILKEYGIEPQVFFAPSHTFDLNTLKALQIESNIRVVSDTPANDCYYKNGIFFIPQQAGSVRKLPFRTITFCYHPNTMTDNSFLKLEKYLASKKIKSFELITSRRNLSFYDKILMKLYYWRHSK